ncbi:MAG: N-acetylglucosamine-6-phosphate deacetylase [Erysipelotrichaceae bacterium]|nr:N-acetylglucosamine-6-phosphate deacetylase [Erysipelotrichaceae bacterium]
MIIQSSRVYIASTLMPAQVEIEDGKIKAVYPYNEKPVDKDYGDKRIVPGFYDVHTHGFHGYDATAGGKDGLRAWAKYLPSEGVCGFCPTTLTQSHDVLIKAVSEIGEVKKEEPEGAEILGIHFEGPYLDVKYKGAQPEEYIVKGTVEEFKEYQEASGNNIKIITLAPEHDEDFALTRYCAQTGVCASIGHTDTTYDIAMMALANGAKGFTHTYNGMTPLGHRENGAVGAAFRSHDTYAEAICDGNHSTLAALNIFFREKQGYGVMVTDSLMCKGYPVGSIFDFGGQDVEIYPDGSAHITTGRKQLAGSTLKVNEGVKILVEKALVPFETAIDAASINPMRYLNMDDHKGRIKVGFDADIVVLDDDYSVVQTYCKGNEQL